MGKSTWSGPIVVGQKTHVTAQRVQIEASGAIKAFNSIDGVEDRPAIASFTQIATVRGNSSGGTNVFLPAGSDLIGVRLILACAASAATSIAGQGVNFRIGRVAGNDAFYGTIKASAVNVQYELGVEALNRTNASATSWPSQSAETQVFIDATAVTSVSALSEMGGRIYFTYVPR